MMPELLFLLIGLAVGAIAAIAAWKTASARAANQASARMTELEAKARAAEGIASEVRSQADKAAAEAGSLRAKLEEESQGRIRAQTRLEQELKNIAEQKATLDQAASRLSDAFRALSGEALKSNNQAFLELARTKLQEVIAEAQGDLGKRQQAIDGLVKPLAAALEKYEKQVQELEKSRQGAYAGLQEQLKAVAATQQELQKETNNLVNALKTPQVRGRWGEVTLHRVVELAGMSEHCDYAQQVSVEAEDGRLRPDMVIHLPSNRDIVVDSKVSLAAYLQAISAASEADRAGFLQQHAQQIRAHMQKLAAKQYWDQFAGRTPEFVVMFIPGESFFASALDCDKGLLEDGMDRRVVLATPTTLIALLKAVAFGWRQEAMARNAQEVCELGRELYERIRVMTGHIIGLGRSLRQTNERYNDAVGSMESRVLPSARKFRDLGAAGGEAIETVKPLDIAPRSLTAEEAPPHEERQ
ncbi:MAG: DNA recombination protein RmuC [Phycisphaerae bacterium]